MNPNQRTRSSLPPEMVESIISFLPPKEATSLSLLSKRFRGSWKSCRDLSFGRTFARNYYRYRYIEIIDKLLEEHSGSKVDRFSVYFDHEGHVEQVQQWLARVVPLGVTELELDFSPGFVTYVLDTTVISSPSIETLNLVRCHLDELFPSNKLLNLKDLTIQRTYLEETIHLESIFSNCLALRIFQLIGCSSLDVINVQAQNLKAFKTLIIKDCAYVKEIELSAPSLCSFHYYGKFCKFNFQGEFPLLDDVILNIASPRKFQVLSRRQAVVEALHQVKVLTVTSTFLEGLGPRYEDYQYKDMVFSLMNVKELQLIILSESNINPLDIVKFLTKCPRVEKVFINLEPNSFSNNLYWEWNGRIPMEQFRTLYPCIHHVRIKGFTNNELPMTLARFLLNSAKYLRSLALVKVKNYKSHEVLTPDYVRSHIYTNARIDIFGYLGDRSISIPKHHV